jgi:hypothetical protein
MAKLLLVLLLLVAVVIGLGFYLEWFSFSTSHDPESGRTGVKLDVDTNKIKTDADKVKQKITGRGAKDKEQPERQ